MMSDLVRRSARSSGKFNLRNEMRAESHISHSIKAAPSKIPICVRSSPPRGKNAAAALDVCLEIVSARSSAIVKRKMMSIAALVLKLTRRVSSHLYRLVEGLNSARSFTNRTHFQKKEIHSTSFRYASGALPVKLRG